MNNKAPSQPAVLGVSLATNWQPLTRQMGKGLLTALDRNEEGRVREEAGRDGCGGSRRGFARRAAACGFDLARHSSR
jgi:hypothetical protein